MEKQLLQSSSAGFNAANAQGLFIQPKLTINQPNDVYEQEADAMADKVMRMEQPGVQLKSLPISSVQRKCEHCEHEEKVQRKENNGEEKTADNNLQNYVGSLNNGGQPLSAEARNFYEPRFGYDFSNVKIHTDTVAAKSAQSINALAYTSGSNIVFNSGQFSPDTDSGKKLLGHELTHVVQQGNSESALVRRQPQPPAGGTPPTPVYTCLQDGTGKNIKLTPGTVTVITYGAPAWCKPCNQLDATLDSICKIYQANSKISANFFAVDVEAQNADQTIPKPAVIKNPTTLVYSGTNLSTTFEGSKPDTDIYPMINTAAANTTAAKTPPATVTPGAPPPTQPAPKETAPPPTTAPPVVPGQPCSFSITGIDGNSTLENTRKYSDTEIAKGRAENPAAKSDAEIPTITNGCPRQTFQLVTNQQNARILHVSWKKTPPAGTLSVTRVAIDDGGDQPPGKARSVSTLNPLTNKLPIDCQTPMALTDKPAWCVPFCSFGDFAMEVSVAYECNMTDGSKQINTILFGPKKITVKETKKP